jgi:hypothetical protein
MKLGGIDRRLEALEERAKPRMIATLADFVIWRAKGCREEVEFTLVMKEAFPMLSRGDDHET